MNTQELGHIAREMAVAGLSVLAAAIIMQQKEASVTRAPQPAVQIPLPVGGDVQCDDTDCIIVDPYGRRIDV